MRRCQAHFTIEDEGGGVEGDVVTPLFLVIYDPLPFDSPLPTLSIMVSHGGETCFGRKLQFNHKDDKRTRTLYN